MLDPLAQAASLLRDFGEVAGTGAWNQRLTPGQLRRTHIGHLPGGRTDGLSYVAPLTLLGIPSIVVRLARPLLLREALADRREQPVDPRVVETTGDRREHREIGIGELRLVRMVTAPLLAHIAQAVLGTPLLALVEYDQVGEVEHVDLLELTCGAVLARHDIQRQVHEIDDLGVGLPDAGRLDNDEIESGRLVQLDHVLQHGRGGEVLPAGGQRPHENRIRRQGVHADAISEERATAAPARGVHRDHGDLQIREGAHQARQELVGETRLTGTAGSGDADDGGLVSRPANGTADLLRGGTRLLRALQDRYGPRDMTLVPCIQRTEFVLRLRRMTQARENIVDHAVQAEAPAVFGGVDLLDAVPFQSVDLLRRDGAPAADDHPDMLVTTLPEHVHHVGEVLVVAALVGAHRDGIGVLLDRGTHDIGDATVMAQMDHLRPVRLEQAPDHVDRGIMAVEQGGGRDEAQRRLGGKLLEGGTALEAGVHGSSRLRHVLYAPVR